MKQRQFRLLIGVILIQSLYFHFRLSNIEDSLTSIYGRVVDANFMLKNL